MMNILKVEKDKKIEELYFIASNKSTTVVYDFNNREERMEKVFYYSTYVVLPLIYPALFIILKLLYIFKQTSGNAILTLNMTLFSAFIAIFVYTFIKTYYMLQLQCNYIFIENKKYLRSYFCLFLTIILTQLSNGFIIPWFYYVPSDQ